MLRYLSTFLVREFLPWSQNEHKAHPRTHKRRYVYVPKGKTSFARRTIPLTDGGISVLKHRMNGHYVFPRPLDSKKHLTTVQKLHEKACRKANLKFRL